jgi:hypothetical protein
MTGWYEILYTNPTGKRLDRFRDTHTSDSTEERREADHEGTICPSRYANPG